MSVALVALDAVAFGLSGCSDGESAFVQACKDDVLFQEDVQGKGYCACFETHLKETWGLTAGEIEGIAQALKRDGPTAVVTLPRWPGRYNIAGLAPLPFSCRRS